jgi:hypothetical protein
VFHECHLSKRGHAYLKYELSGNWENSFPLLPLHIGGVS